MVQKDIVEPSALLIKGFKWVYVHIWTCMYKLSLCGFEKIKNEFNFKKNLILEFLNPFFLSQ